MLWKTQRAARALPVRTLPILTLLILGLGGSPSLARDINIEIWCPDVNRDLFVDARDVQLLMEVWGQSCPTHPEDPHDTCPADVNHNGVVGRLDLARMQGAWGPCRCKGDLNGDGMRDQLDVDLLDQAIAAGVYCGADIDHDGRVTAMDFEIAQETWSETQDPDPDADADRDGFLEITDVLEVLDAMLEARDCRGEITADGRVDGLDRILLVALANEFPNCP